MANKKIGKQTVKLSTPPTISSVYSIVGPKEGEGPLAKYFDMILEDEAWGEKTWEKTESKIVKECVAGCLGKEKVSNEDIDYMFSGDLLNQCVSSCFGIREREIPYFGLFGACSTFVEGMSLGAMLIDGGMADNVLCSTSSHFCSAEKQFRFPLELGNQRPPTAQWTVTGSGTALLKSNGQGPFITHVTTGKIVDMGVKDSMNMGACMAPAACDTLYQHMMDFDRKPEDYDRIVTGDLGYVGRDIIIELMNQKGFDISQNYSDCGIKMFDKDTQDTHAGGSGCGCSATVLCAYYLRELEKGNIKRMLFMPTGALLSKVSFNEGRTVPGIAHAVVLEHC